MKASDSENEKEWRITERKIKHILTNLHHLNFKNDKIYSIEDFGLSHDRIKVRYDSGYFLTLFAGNIPIGGIFLGKGGFYYDPPKQLAIDEIDSDLEEYQLMRFTGTKEEAVYSNGKTKFENEPFEDGFVLIHPDKFEDYIDPSLFKKVEDKTTIYDCLSKSRKILKDILAQEYKFPGIKEKSFYVLPEDEEMDSFSCGVNTKEYDWLFYTQSPLGNESFGIRKEVWLGNKFNYLASTHEGWRIFGMYDSKDQRESMTRSQLEHDSKEKVMTIHETVACKIKEKKTESANVKSKLSLRILENGVEAIPFLLSSKMKITAITDDDGFALPFCRSGRSIQVFPIKRLKKGEIRNLTFYINGQISYEMARGILHSDPSIISPSTGYLQCRTLDLLVKTPKPQVALSVGELVEDWEEENYNVMYWKSDECIRFWSIIYGDYEIFKSELELPTGKLPFYLYYTPSEFRIKMANKRRMVNETENVMRWLSFLYGNYPYPKIAVSQKSVVSGYSQGFPSMLQISGFAFISDMELEYFGLTGWIGTWGSFGPAHLAHEAGHQWWGNIVGWARNGDQWLSEGVTEQQAPNYVQARDKNDVILKDTLDDRRTGAIKHDREGPIILGNLRLGFRPYIKLTYGKAPYVMNMLRMIMGEETFVNICRQFIKAFAFKQNPTTSDFVEIVSRTLGEEYCTKRFGEKDMKWFFDQWIYGRGIPEFAFAYKTYKDGRKWKAKCRVKMLNGVLFKVPARIAVYNKKKKDPYFVEVVLEPKEVQEFEIELKGEPDKLFLNKFNAVLSRGTTYEKF